MNKTISLTATNVLPVEPQHPIKPGPGQKTITLTAKNVFPIEDLDTVKLGPQPTPDHPMIFNGTMSEFLDIPIVEMNNRTDAPSRTPLDTCPTVREKVCSVCDWYDGHVGCVSGDGDG